LHYFSRTHGILFACHWRQFKLAYRRCKIDNHRRQRMRQRKLNTHELAGILHYKFIWLDFSSDTICSFGQLLPCLQRTIFQLYIPIFKDVQRVLATGARYFCYAEHTIRKCERGLPGSCWLQCNLHLYDRLRTMISKSAVSQFASTAIVIAIIVAAFSGYAVGSLSQGTTQTIYTNTQTAQTVTFVSFVTESVSETVTSTLTTAVTPIVPQAGLQLEVNLNATAIQYGGDLIANVELFNPLSANLSLSVSYSNDQNIVAWNSKDFLCSLTPVYDLFGFALYQGYYTSSNISRGATPLLLTPQPEIGCPTTYQPNISENITFPPENNSAIVSKVSSSLLSMEVDATTEGCRLEQGGNVTIVTSANGTLTTQTTTGLGGFSCGSGSSLSGYWTTPPAGETCAQLPTANDTVPKNMIGPYCNLVSFPLGSYSLVAQDVWNQTVFAYFQVIPAK